MNKSKHWEKLNNVLLEATEFAKDGKFVQVKGMNKGLLLNILSDYVDSIEHTAEIRGMKRMAEVVIEQPIDEKQIIAKINKGLKIRMAFGRKQKNQFGWTEKRWHDWVEDRQKALGRQLIRTQSRIQSWNKLLTKQRQKAQQLIEEVK